MFAPCRTVKRSQYEQINDEVTTFGKGTYILRVKVFFTRHIKCKIEINNYYHWIFVRNKLWFGKVYNFFSHLNTVCLTCKRVCVERVLFKINILIIIAKFINYRKCLCKQLLLRIMKFVEIHNKKKHARFVIEACDEYMDHSNCEVIEIKTTCI